MSTIETTANLPLARGQRPPQQPAVPRALVAWLEGERAAGRPVRLNRKTAAGLRSMGRTDLVAGGSRQSQQLRNIEINAELQKVRIAQLQSRRSR